MRLLQPSSICLACSWAAKKQLKDMAGTLEQRNYGVEYRGQLYFPAGLEEQRQFLANPEQYLSGQPFPSASRLPVRLSPGDVAAHGASGVKLGLKGFCPVSLMEVCSIAQLSVCEKVMFALCSCRIRNHPSLCKAMMPCLFYSIIGYSSWRLRTSCVDSCKHLGCTLPCALCGRQQGLVL